MKMAIPTALASRAGIATPRRSIIAVVIGVTLVGCSGYEQLLLTEFAETVGRYFAWGGFERDLTDAVDFTRKVLGSAGIQQ
jgi:uncharacterized membrane protein